MGANDFRGAPAPGLPFSKAVVDKLFEDGEDMMRQLPTGERQASLRPIWENYRELVFGEWLALGVECQRAAALAMHEAYLNRACRKHRRRQSTLGVEASPLACF